MAEADLLERTVRDLLRDRAELAPHELGVDIGQLTTRGGRAARMPMSGPARAGGLVAAAAAVTALAVGLGVGSGSGTTTHPGRPGRSHVAAVPSVRDSSAAIGWSDSVDIGRLVRTGVDFDGHQLALGIGRGSAPAPTYALIIGEVAGGASGGQPTYLRTSIVGLPDTPPSTAAGFHDTYDTGGFGSDHHRYLFVGYFVGREPAITATVDGVRLTAAVASAGTKGLWVWWLPGPTSATYAAKGTGPQLTRLVASDPSTGQVIAVDTRGAAHG